METALISLISMALVIIGIVTMTMNVFHSTSTLADSWKQMEEQAGSIRRTEIVAVPPQGYDGGIINLTVENQGQTNLDNFPRWDVIAQRQGEAADYIEYSEGGLGNNQWIVDGIYLPDDSPEVFDFNILNPGEKMIVLINLIPTINQGETGRITISTPNGVASQCLVTRQ